MTGVGFFDHMLDQFNSHAQVGIGLTVLPTMSASNPYLEPKSGNRNRLANQNQINLCTAVGKEVGSAMLTSLGLEGKADEAQSRFCCPLDEALVECVIRKAGSDTGSVLEYTLPPYGIYPKGKGRTKIGEWETIAVESFWTALANTAKLDVEIRKIRGDNGHHIVESSFKAFSRALRNHVDSPLRLWDVGGQNDLASIALEREAKVERSTKETSILVHMKLNGKGEESTVETGIPVLDEFLITLAHQAKMSLVIQCTGDLWVDDHHTAEDVSIAIGQCWTQALGSKAGLNRMWLAEECVGDAKVEVTMDLSNRPYLAHNLHDSLGLQEYIDPERPGSEASVLSCEMFEHVLDSLVMNGRMTVHIVEKQKGTSLHETIMATAKALGEAFRVCAMVDRRRAGQTASSKGTLSV